MHAGDGAAPQPQPTRATGSARDYARGGVRLELLRALVPLQREVTYGVLSRHFAPAALAEYTLAASERAVESVPPRVGAEVLCWGRRCDVDVQVPARWLSASGARFVPGNAHRRDTLAALCELWAAQAELAALERAQGDEPPPGVAAAPPDSQPAAADQPELWTVDFRRMAGPDTALNGPIPVVALDGRTLAEIPRAHATHMRSRSPRLADALRIGYANFEHWRRVEATPGGADLGADAGAAVREQLTAFVSTAGALFCKSCVYFLDTYCDARSGAPHRPGALASQVYVGIVGSKDGEQARRLHLS